MTRIAPLAIFRAYWINQTLAVRTRLSNPRAWLLAGVAMLVVWGASTAAAAPPVTLTVGMEDANNWPFEGEDTSGALSGFHVELIRAVAEQLGWQVEFKRYPWKRAIYMLNSGDVQAVSYVAKSDERNEFAVFNADNVLHLSRTSMFIRRDRSDEIHVQVPLEGMMRRWRFGASQGYYYNDEIVNLINAGVPIDQSAITPVQLFRMLDRGCFDVAFAGIKALQRAEAHWPGIQQHFQKLDGVVMDGKAMYLAFSRKSGASLANTFAQAYRSYRHSPAYLHLAGRFGVRDSLPKAGEFR